MRRIWTPKRHQGAIWTPERLQGPLRFGLWNSTCLAHARGCSWLWNSAQHEDKSGSLYMRMDVDRNARTGRGTDTGNETKMPFPFITQILTRRFCGQPAIRRDGSGVSPPAAELRSSARGIVRRQDRSLDRSPDPSLRSQWTGHPRSS
jgi:hypothetical protein